MRTIALAVVIGFAAGAASATDITPEQAYTLVVQTPWTPTPPPKPEELAAARATLEAAARREPSVVRWTYALAHLTMHEARALKGDAAEAKREEALELFRKASERDPKNADYLFWLADASFDRIDDVNMLSKMSLASAGRKAYEQAVAIDPNHVGSHVGLGQYYLQAPGIAGGSVEKAKKEGETLLAIPGGRGAFQGHMLLAGIAAKDQDWAAMSRHYTAAETSGGDGANPAAAMRSQAWRLLNDKNDAAAAGPVIERYLKIASPDDLTAIFLDGEVKRRLGRCADALPRFEQVLAKYPVARGSRWGAAVCRESLGQKDAARHDYEEFLKHFPDDDKAKEAKAAVKRLAG